MPYDSPRRETGVSAGCVSQHPGTLSLCVTESVAVRQDIVLSREGGRCEPASARKADVTFRCTAETYVLVLFRHCTVEVALRDGRLSYEGDPEIMAAFGQAFVGG